MKLTTYGNESKFVAQLATVVEELVNIQNKINLSRVKEQGTVLNRENRQFVIRARCCRRKIKRIQGEKIEIFRDLLNFYLMKID